MTDFNQLVDKFGPNFGYLEEIYRLYEQDPSLVSSKWANFFESFDRDQSFDKAAVKINKDSSIATAEVSYAQPLQSSAVSDFDNLQKSDLRLQESVFRLVKSYRDYGHLRAKVNPLSQGIVPLPDNYLLDVNYYQFSEQQLLQELRCYHFQNSEKMILADLIAQLQKVYCGSIGFEFEHIQSEEERYWLRDKIENRFSQGYVLSAGKKIRRLQKIIDAEVFEDQLHKKYIGQKRFSLEGGETLIPLIADMIDYTVENGQQEVVLGMAHRGRLNVLRNILGKPLKDIFYEFEDGTMYSVLGSGDVKYHMGFSSQFHSPDGNSLKLNLAPNPSHLEFVYPVIQGICRAKQDLHYSKDRSAVVPLIIHGDAAFIGQGIVTETLNSSYVPGYDVGGSIHVVINNQIGFTTTPDESRSSVYCSDFAKAIQAPILHINGEDVVSACWASHLAMEYRNKFKKDVVLDLYCYRKYGHNEGDDPSFTNPLLYKEISKKPLISQIFGSQLIEQGVISQAQIEEYRQSVKDEFEREQQTARPPQVMGEACAMHGRLRVQEIKTAISEERLHEIAQNIVSFPADFHPNPKLKKILEQRSSNARNAQPFDWGMAETLAFGSLLQDKVSLRLSGQDCGRGTFSHRQLLINDFENGNHYMTLSPVCSKYGAELTVLNSTLSENAILAFEFGYSSVDLNKLIMWEAQFGDFANGAQVIIDQFISSSEQKWNQLSGLVMLLPHGFEGQGPEHSSARLERYLQLCADGNMVVCYPTNSSQYFHMLRRHALSPLKRPLIVMTPKSLLRANEAMCTSADLTSGTFKEIIVSDYNLSGSKSKLVFASGKVFYDIDKALKAIPDANTRVIRVEQLYPFPQYLVKKFAKEVNADKCVWVQEEPLNMGAFLYIEPYLRRKLDLAVEYAGREVSASPSTGSPKRHAFEQQQLISKMLELLKLK